MDGLWTSTRPKERDQSPKPETGGGMSAPPRHNLALCNAHSLLQSLVPECNTAAALPPPPRMSPLPGCRQGVRGGWRDLALEVLPGVWCGRPGCLAVRIEGGCRPMWVGGCKAGYKRTLSRTHEASCIVGGPKRPERRDRYSSSKQRSKQQRSVNSSSSISTTQYYYHYHCQRQR